MKNELKKFIQYRCKELGFSHVGFAQAAKVSDAEHFKSWLKKSYHGSMAWMENYTEKRLDPCQLFEGCKTIVCFSTNYYNYEYSKTDDVKIARYALGDDYHDVIKKRLLLLYDDIIERFPMVKGRAFSDTAPILERYWAEQAGIGWIGKNTMLISREYGSYTFLSEMFLNVELEADSPHKNYCGTCTNCLTSCPTNAFEQAYVLNANKCISYITIEKRDELSTEEEQILGKNLFGCDICQEVCPWNRFAKLTQDPNFVARTSLLKKPISFWENMTRDEYTLLFKKSAAKRTKYQGLMRNIKAIIKNGEK